MSSEISMQLGTTCEYLFHRKAEEVFSHINLKAEKLSAFVDECLDLSIRVQIHILTHKPAYFLIDPLALNHQCHLYTLTAVELLRRYPKMSLEDKLARTEDNRFLHLCFYLSHPLLCNSKFLMRTLDKALSEMGVKVKPGPAKQFRAFFNDEKGLKERIYRLALNEYFQVALKESLAQLDSKIPYGKELRDLAAEDLSVKYTHGHSKIVLYTYPKFSGVVHMLDLLQSRAISMVFKVRVYNQEGVAGTVVHKCGDCSEESPVMVFEGVAVSDGCVSLVDIKKAAERCPRNFYRLSDERRYHKLIENCQFCREAPQIDLEPHRERLHKAVQDPYRLFTALGADFIMNTQNKFMPYFQKTEKYPELSRIFERAQADIHELGVGASSPTTLAICHAYPDIASHALCLTEYVQSTPPEQLLLERGII